MFVVVKNFLVRIAENTFSFKCADSMLGDALVTIAFIPFKVHWERK
jgi:hypothetical protein